VTNDGKEVIIALKFGGMLMEPKDDESTITLRRCDLNGVMSMLTLGNYKAVDSAWVCLKKMEDIARIK